jgi:hypothetical protein
VWLPSLATSFWALPGPCPTTSPWCRVQTLPVMGWLCRPHWDELGALPSIRERLRPAGGAVLDPSSVGLVLPAGIME